MSSYIHLFFFIIISFPILPLNEKDNINKTINENFNKLNGDVNFINFDLGLSDFEKKAIDSLNIKLNTYYENYGKLNLLKEELSNFLKKIGKNDENIINTVTDTIYNITLQVKDAFKKETAWVSVRIFLPDSKFNYRWHYDGYYYQPNVDPAIKFITTLKGDSTIFCKISKELRTKFNLNLQNQECLNNLLLNTKIEHAKEGNGTLFIVGDKHNAAIHSEPYIKECRLFLSVLPGNENEINQIYQRNYPIKYRLGNVINNIMEIKKHVLNDEYKKIYFTLGCLICLYWLLNK